MVDEDNWTTTIGFILAGSIFPLLALVFPLPSRREFMGRVEGVT
jgi:hypothetical protein